MSSRLAPRLFVYGTLKVGFDNRWAKALRDSATLLGPPLASKWTLVPGRPLSRLETICAWKRMGTRGAFSASQP